MLSRRLFLRRSAAASAAASFAILPARAQSDPRPNILLCIAPDWAYPYAAVHGDPVVRTPNFDRIARDGVVFTRAFAAAPSPTASRAAILSGLPAHALGSAANFHGALPASFLPYTTLLERAGYAVASQGLTLSAATLATQPLNPAGQSFKNLAQFIATVEREQPFCYWFGATDPARPFNPDLRRDSKIKPEDVRIPPWLPDTPAVRDDLADYLRAVQRFDKTLGDLLTLLDRTGRRENTLVLVTSANGLPFPRAKANCYDPGLHVPLAVRWPARLKHPGRDEPSLVSLIDLAPTFLQIAGLPIPRYLPGHSLTDIIVEDSPDPRPAIFAGRERHADCRPDHLGYPIRAVRTASALYIRNFFPERSPAGPPDAFADIEPSPTKTELLDNAATPDIAPFFARACAPRPAEELYDLDADPGQLTNLAQSPAHASQKATLAAQLRAWMTRTHDPRATTPRTNQFDAYPPPGP